MESASRSRSTAALPFLVRAKSVDLVKIAEAPKITVEFDALVEYLALRGIEATENVVDPGGSGVTASLVSWLEKRGADLLVMGAYGHRRLREVIFGGVTRNVLFSGLNIPVLMTH